ncbi:MAG: hypothetical protein HXX19_12800 [Rhodoferax sp.]|nr:hypothetical protein [Rhodoferax sp.]
MSSSLMGLLREAETATGTPAQLERIRQALLDSMAVSLDAHAALPKVWARVQHAPDMQSLWYLRSDVMHLLCDHCGEALARDKLNQITELFRGHLPKAQFASSRRQR